MSCVIACPYDGPTKPAEVRDMAMELLDMGCYEVSLGDTIGVGTPGSIEMLVKDLQQRISNDQLAAHFHDTYGQAVANCVKAYEMGIRTFDSSIGGLGGCPYARGATGNVSTEDLVYWFATLVGQIISSDFLVSMAWE